MAAETPAASASRWPPTGRDLIAVVAVGMTVVVLVAVALGLEAAHQAKLARERAAEAEAVKAAEPRRAPPITSSVYVRAVPVRHAG